MFLWRFGTGIFNDTFRYSSFGHSPGKYRKRHVDVQEAEDFAGSKARSSSIMNTVQKSFIRTCCISWMYVALRCHASKQNNKTLDFVSTRKQKCLCSRKVQA